MHGVDAMPEMGDMVYSNSAAAVPNVYVAGAKGGWAGSWW